MKKIDKNIFLTVVLGVSMLSLLTSLITCFNNGFANVIVKGDQIYSAFYILTGILLNVPIVLFILKFLEKDRCIKFVSPLINLGIIFLIFVFGIVLAATDWPNSAGYIFIIVAELILKFFIVDFTDFLTLIHGAKSAVKVDNEKTEVIENEAKEEPVKEEISVEAKEEPAKEETEEKESN